MQKTITYKEVTVAYEDRGKGACIFFIHGYLETRGIWNEFTGRLLDGFRVVAMDLPGHGDSGTWGEVHLMEDLAGSIRAILEAEDLDKVFLVGHSLGGYVTMAFADLYPERLSGYCLFHSTCFADTEEKRQNRDREISLVRSNKKQQLIHVNIPRMFADINLEPFGQQVEKAEKMALTTSNEGIEALLNGMKKRPDRTHVLRDNGLPLLLIGGAMDNYIPVGVFEKLVVLAPHASVLRLEKSGHIGFIEEPEPAARAIREKALDCMSS